MSWDALIMVTRLRDGSSSRTGKQIRIWYIQFCSNSARCELQTTGGVDSATAHGWVRVVLTAGQVSPPRGAFVPVGAASWPNASSTAQMPQSAMRGRVQLSSFPAIPPFPAVTQPHCAHHVYTVQCILPSRTVSVVHSPAWENPGIFLFVHWFSCAKTRFLPVAVAELCSCPV